MGEALDPGAQHMARRGHRIGRQLARQQEVLPQNLAGNGVGGFVHDAEQGAPTRRDMLRLPGIVCSGKPLRAKVPDADLATGFGAQDGRRGRAGEGALVGMRCRRLGVFVRCCPPRCKIGVSGELGLQANGALKATAQGVAQNEAAPVDRDCEAVSFCTDAGHWGSAVNGVFEPLRGLELGGFAGGNLNRRAVLGVGAGTRGALFHRERAEAGDGDAVPSLECSVDAGEDDVEGRFGECVRRARGGGDVANQVLLVHGVLLAVTRRFYRNWRGRFKARGGVTAAQGTAARPHRPEYSSCPPAFWASPCPLVAGWGRALTLRRTRSAGGELGVFRPAGRQNGSAADRGAGVGPVLDEQVTYGLEVMGVQPSARRLNLVNQPAPPETVTPARAPASPYPGTFAQSQTPQPGRGVRHRQ